MMQQYLELKEQYKDCLLFFRLGDFYEMFFDDAILVSRELELTLTGRDCGLAERAPMCGVPFHSVEQYVNRLIDKGPDEISHEDPPEQPSKRPLKAAQAPASAIFGDGHPGDDKIQPAS